MKDIFDTLVKKDIQELGVLDILGGMEFLKESFDWIRGSSPTVPRTLWCLEDPNFPTTNQLEPLAKSRYIPMDPVKHQAWSQGMGPFQAVLKKGKEKPDLIWMKLYAWAGDFESAGEYGGYTLWVWISKFPKRRALLICHHSGVLPDVRRQLLTLNVKGEFYWLCDGKPPNGDAWPSSFAHLTSSIPLLQGPYEQSFSNVEQIRNTYSFICTSHCMRYPVIFAKFGLPLLHINSTRYSNYLVTRKDLLKDLNIRIEALLTSGQLTIVHNNKADAWYFSQYIQTSGTIIRSLCDSPLRFRIDSPKSGKYLLWDTRSHVGTSKSPTLGKIAKLSNVDATSTLSKYHGGWLDDDMLKGYDTVIHIPYNISTMSCFEQGSANIPMWIPTARLLKKILLEEYSELSWYCFGGDRSTAERPDQVWIEEVVEEYVKRADFYTGVFGCTLEFDSVEELQEKIHTIDYDALVKKSYAHIVKEKLEVAKGYLQVLPV